MKKSIGAKTLLHPTPVLLVGTYDPEGKPNVMTVSWGGICCSMPPCLAISMRKATHTHNNIVKRKAFTVSIPSEIHLKQVDYCGLVSGRSVDKFAESGFTPVRAERVDAPFVDECALVLECKLIHQLELGLHTQFIGEIQDVKAEPSVLNAEGTTDLEKLQPLVFQPDRQTYYGIGKSLGPAFSIGEDLGAAGH